MFAVLVFSLLWVSLSYLRTSKKVSTIVSEKTPSEFDIRIRKRNHFYKSDTRHGQRDPLKIENYEETRSKLA